MKKLLVVIIVLAFVVIASSTMAQTAKVPKALCLATTSGNEYNLVIKSLGNVISSGGKVKLYSVIGYADTGSQGPVHGNGYVVPGTTTFHVTFNGKAGYESHVLKSIELSINLATLTGSSYSRYDYTDGSITTFGPVDMSSIDCSTISIASSVADKSEDSR